MHETKTLAMRLLAVRSYFACELEKKLQEKKCPPDEIAQVLEECKSFGYLNDEEHMKAYIRSCLNKKLGPRAIAMKLRNKGLEREVVDEAVEALGEDEGQQENIQKLLESRYQKRDIHDYKQRQKVIASLMRKGYELPVILEQLQKLGSKID